MPRKHFLTQLRILRRSSSPRPHDVSLVPGIPEDVMHPQPAKGSEWAIGKTSFAHAPSVARLAAPPFWRATSGTQPKQLGLPNMTPANPLLRRMCVFGCAFNSRVNINGHHMHTGMHVYPSLCEHIKTGTWMDG